MNYGDLEAQYSLPNGILSSIRSTESANGKNLLSDAGALGDFQFMPSTAKAYGINPLDPAQAADGAARMLADLGKQYKGNWPAVVAHYNGGSAAGKAVMSGKAPPAAETQAYIPKVMAGVSKAPQMSVDDAANLLGLAPKAQQPATPDGKSVQDAAKLLGLDAAPAQLAKKAPEKGIIESIGAGIGYGVGQTGLAFQQLLGRGIKNAASLPMLAPLQAILAATGIGNKNASDILVNDAAKGIANTKEQVKPYQDSQPVATTAGNIAGSVASQIPLTAMAPISKGVSLFNAAKTGAATGALSGLLNPVANDSAENNDFLIEKAKQAGIGGATGGIAAPAFNMIGKIISPNVRPDVATLIEQGVTPTPGQILGGNFARTEDKLTSLPVVGGMIKNAQTRALDDLNRAAYARALDPIGVQAPQQVGREGVAAVKTAISNAYDDLLPKLQFKADQQFGAELGNVTNMVANAQTNPDVARQFTKVVQNDLLSRMSKTGTMDGRSFKDMESAIGQSIKKYGSSPNPADKDIANALSEVLSSARNALGRENPQYADNLSNINRAYANYARIRDAAGRIGTDGGSFTAAQLQSAVRAADKSAGKGSFATGNALMQDLSEAGKNVLGSKYPDTGTAGRMAAMTLTPAAFLAAPATTTATIGGLGLATLPYTKAGQRLAAGLLTSRPEFADPVSQVVRRAGLLTVPALSPLLNN